MDSFVIKYSKKGYYFVIKACNSENILVGEIYKRLRSAENGIRAALLNKAEDKQYSRRKSRDGQFYFVLKAANHRIIGTSEMYKTEQAREKGIDAVKNCLYEPLIRIGARTYR